MRCLVFRRGLSDLGKLVTQGAPWTFLSLLSHSGITTQLFSGDSGDQTRVLGVAWPALCQLIHLSSPSFGFIETRRLSWPQT